MFNKYLAFIIFAFSIASSCNPQKSVTKAPPLTPIKVEIMDQTASWKKVDSLEQQGLVRSALETVLIIKEQSYKSQDSEQIIKSIFYENKFEAQLEEDASEKIIARLETDVARTPEPAKSVLHSVLAELYSNYLQQHLYKMQNKTETPGQAPDDVRLWSVGHFVDTIASHYTSSIRFSGLKDMAVSDYNIILSKDQGTDELRPTLFDILSNRAIDYFIQDRSHLTDPVYRYILDEPVAFGNVDQFINHSFGGRDSKSYVLSTLQLFQNVLSFHQKEGNQKALLSANLKRLRYAHDKMVRSDKTQLYLQTLDQLADTHNGQEAEAEVRFRQAELYASQGYQYNAKGDTSNQWQLKKAHDIAQSMISKYPNSYGAKYCQRLINNVLNKNFEVSVEEVVLPGEEILVFSSYKNIKSLRVKIVKVTEDEKNDMMGMRNDEILRFLNGKSASIMHNVDLPQLGDFQQHSTEFGVANPGLGNYVMMTSSGSNFSNGQILMTSFYVSSLAYFEINQKGASGNFVVTHRKSGSPKAAVTASFFERIYKPGRRNYELKRVGNATSDQNGFFKANVNTSANGRSFMVRLQDGSDVLMLDESFSNYIQKSNRRRTRTTHFFTDRAIYRPGQTIYFKGYLMATDEKRMPRIQANQDVIIKLHDVNGQEKGAMTLRSNEYGTVNGSFQIPNSGLTGQMSLRADFGNGSKYFRVEEYKRPRFEVEILPVEEQIKLDQQVTMIGKATNFAGTPVDGATVNYRVERVRFQPYWRYGYYRWNPRPTDKMVITYGSVTTNNGGTFEIPFLAKAEAARKDEKDLYYTFNVYADVVDISGETRSANSSIKLGQKSYTVDLKIGELTPNKNLSNIPVIAKTLNGQDAEVNGTMTISRLNIPNQAYRDRYWGMPDQPILQEGDFESRFANYLYPGKEKMPNWEVLNSLPGRSININGADTISLAGMNLNAGAYKIQLETQNDQGEQLVVDRYTIVYDIENGQIPNYIRYVEEINRTKFEPGETLQYSVGSGIANKPHIVRVVDRQEQTMQKDWLNLNPTSRTELVIRESDRGGLKVGHFFVLNNRFYTYEKAITIPWSNKDLQITYSTYRDKLLPGQDEEWIVKISGPKQDQVSAEMLATLYDASLDAFTPHQWMLNLYPNYYSFTNARGGGFKQGRTRYLQNNSQRKYVDIKARNYRQLNMYDFPIYGYAQRVFSSRSDGISVLGNRRRNKGAPAPAAEAMESDMMEQSKEMDAVQVQAENEGQPDDASNDTGSEKSAPLSPKIRTDLDETVFFKPSLQTNEKGDVLIKFKMKEALTKWKFLGLAHTKDLKFALTENEVVTQKELMVFPNLPRFFRQGDQIYFSTKVNNVSEQTLTGNATLNILEFLDQSKLNQSFGIQPASQSFSIEPGSSKAFEWVLSIPNDRYTPVRYQVIADAGSFSDGEEGLIPVMSNRMLVTETIPLPVKSNESKAFSFKGLSEANSNNTLDHHKYTLEFTSNPAWYAVQALPYLMEYPHDCSEQIFSRMYANVLAGHIANKYPKIKGVFDQWKNTNSDALLSNLSKNQELKSALLEETPWVIDALDEAQQKKNIALLFDLNKMNDEREQAVQKLKNLQLSNGGFAWFKGGRDNWYITQYILEGMGHLQKLNALNISEDNRVNQIVNGAINYCDRRLIERYDELERRVNKGNAKWEDDHLGSLQIHFLYARSFFKDHDRSAKLTKVINYYLDQSKAYWLKKSLYEQGLLALSTSRMNEAETSTAIVKSLAEKSILNDELGRYWKTGNGYYWYQLPIERHSLMVEVFDELTNDQTFVDDLRVWLLKNKQTNRWETTKSTASAIYALLIQEDNWLESDQLVSVKIGGEPVNFAEEEVELGTGYVKKEWPKDQINGNLSNIEVSNANNHIAWGAAYWQYFEDMDKIKFFEETPLKMTKELYVERSSDRGPKAIAIEEAGELKPGDKVLVRLIVETDRDMEFIHLKDMRASGFEPLDVLSTYRWQGGLGYYQSTKDLATHFFFDYLPRGRYVLEYDLRASLKGDFSNGISTIQSMYAPEFTGHTEGRRVAIN